MDDFENLLVTASLPDNAMGDRVDSLKSLIDMMFSEPDKFNEGMDRVCGELGIDRQL